MVGKIKQHKKMYIIAAIVILVAIIGGMFGVVHAALGTNETLKNVYIDEVYVGQMTKEEVKEEVDAYVKELKKKKITFKAEDKKKTVKVDKLGVTFEKEQAVEAAYGVGRDGNLFSNFFAICKARKNPITITLTTSVSEKKGKSVIKKYEKNLIKKTKNASLKRKDGEFIIKKEVVGQEIKYDESVATLVESIAAWDKKDCTIKISVKKEKPEYTAEDLKDIKDVLGSYSTSYASSSYNRRRNVENGCKKINGTMLYPGETLSVYGTVSPFNASNGYYLAPSYASGKVVESYGGGICQVSTTLYNAVLRSELKVVERSNHSMTVHYVPLAADAAIAGTSKDFKFKNNKKTPIYIEGRAGGGTLTFKIYGKETRDENRKIEFQSKTLSVKAPGEVRVKDPTLPKGKEVITERGTTGYVAQLWKVVYEDGKEVSRTKVNTSTYRSTQTKISVGTKEPKPETPATTATPGKGSTSTTVKKKKPSKPSGGSSSGSNGQTTAPESTEPSNSEE